jgi:hypothetical protein
VKILVGKFEIKENPFGLMEQSVEVGMMAKQWINLTSTDSHKG